MAEASPELTRALQSLLKMDGGSVVRPPRADGIGLTSLHSAVQDALAEYDKHDGTGYMPCPTARRMADILRNALQGEG